MLKDQAVEEDVYSDHLVFFVHGMGQQYEKYGNMKHHVSTMQKNTTEILSSRYPNKKIRVKYIPIEWHSEVHKMVDDKINRSTLNTVPKVRLTTNEWLMDCLYYFSKPHGQYIIDSVCNQCNAAYLQHKSDHPGFKGDVHFIGFSLGGIIVYDIASMQWLQEDGLPPWHDTGLEEPVCRTPDIKVPLLDFKIRSVFTCGSPIAAGLVCRGLDYVHYRPPFRTKIYNIFHPFDPLGYRLEPMVNSDYESIEPVQIDRMKRYSSSLPKIPNLGIRSSIAGAKPLLQSFWQYVSSTVIRNEIDSTTPEKELHTVINDVTVSKKRVHQEEGRHSDKKRRLSSISQEQVRVETESSKEDTALSIEGQDGCLYPRTDYVLSENLIDAYASEWIVALKSHFRYWANRDLALHIIKVFLNES
ncbi:DDHD domain-containing protein [Choanephora cucurbitarum]|nr:DDHD domain-containing protein [Choanephora cucurbitarum]